MARFIRFIFRHRAMLIVLSVGALIVPVWAVRFARIDNSIEVWMSRQSAAYQRYEDFRRRYGSDEMIVIGVPMPAPLSAEAVKSQRELASALRQIKGIRDVTSLPDVYAAVVARSPNDGRDLPKHPMIRNLLLSEDGGTIGMVAWLDRMTGPDARREVVDAVQQATALLISQGYQVHLVGTPVLNVALDRASIHEATRLMPVAAALSIGMLVVLFRSVIAPLPCLLATASTLLWTVAAMVMSGTTLNLITVTLPALLVVLSIAPGMHMTVRYHSHLATGQPCEMAMEQTLSELFMPLVLTTLTTAIGFASLMITDMQPVFEAGVFAMVGVLLSLLFSLTMVPGLLMLLPVRQSSGWSSGSIRPHWTTSAGKFMASRHRGVVISSLLIVPALGLIVRSIRTETNVLSFLPTNSKVAQDYRLVSESLTGLYTLELDAAVSLQEEQAAQKALCQLGEILASHPGVARVDHYGQFNSLMAAEGLFKLLPTTLDPVHLAASHFRIVENETVHLRMSLMVRSMASGDFESIIEATSREAASLMPASARWGLTGAVLLMSNAQAALVRTQVRSFAIAAVLVLAVIGVLMRSWGVMVAAIVPNLLPVLVMFSLMRLMNLSINPATVMIASVAIGLAVDGTIHFLTSYRHAAGLNPVSAATAAMEVSGRPIVFAALVAAAGFALLAMAEFAPLREFGLLTGVTLVIAMFCDVLITPAWAIFLRLRENFNVIAGR